ncbi:MAG: queuine tRNA-ribosyltransferase [Chloroflexi bacterium]|nr:queuine tRNA-ribosyltransferase [Chloroflexota bacterium]
MPVGTQATVKGLTPRDLVAIGTTCLLANAYHLLLRPGEHVVAQAGGLHSFMGWDRSTFKSHLDGETRTLTPERAMEVQAALGSDIAMVLDVCPPYPCGPAELSDATHLTTRWASRALSAPHAAGQGVFGIVQGGVDLALRDASARSLAELPFDGFGIGGLSVGEPRAQTWPALDASVKPLPEGRPRYLMGVGAPSDLLEAIVRGVDLFDCVLPTRLGRHGAVLTPHGRLDLHRGSAAADGSPLDPGCDCPACTQFPVTYLRHLVRSGEDLGLRLASLHNLRFLTRLVERARGAIVNGTFRSFVEEHRALSR